MVGKMSRDAHMRARKEARHTITEAAQLETAIGFVLKQLALRNGECPRITRAIWREATRLMRLSTEPRCWHAYKPVEPYLEAAGFNHEGRIVDYEKFYAHREAHKARKRSGSRNK